MPRIHLVTEASMTDAQRRVYDAMMSGPRHSPPVGPLAAAMHRPDLAEKWSELGLVLRFNSSFEPRLREFVILLTGRFLDCQFEWFSHEAEARKAGLSETTIETLRHGRSTFAAPDEQAIHDYATELLRDHRASDATYHRILDAYGTAGIVELTALIGYYAMVALPLNAHEIGVPEGASLPLPVLPGHRAMD
ncbi:MAG TPA: carboxymuconolactone decarboxylase family protein [Acetobacteraceae bacterium]|nr:carboxymuconolactone decarboxylase family protein [Acetobacteraceae bacterium]